MARLNLEAIARTERELDDALLQALRAVMLCEHEWEGEPIATLETIAGNRRAAYGTRLLAHHALRWLEQHERI